MKGSTARKVLKIYRIGALALGIIVIGGGLLAILIQGFRESWVGTLCFLGVIAFLLGIVALGIEADVNKDNPD